MLHNLLLSQFILINNLHYFISNWCFIKARPETNHVIHNTIAECERSFWRCDQDGHQASTKATREEEKKASRLFPVSTLFFSALYYINCSVFCYMLQLSMHASFFFSIFLLTTWTSPSLYYFNSCLLAL